MNENGWSGWIGRMSRIEGSGDFDCRGMIVEFHHLASHGENVLNHHGEKIHLNDHYSRNYPCSRDFQHVHAFCHPLFHLIH